MERWVIIESGKIINLRFVGAVDMVSDDKTSLVLELPTWEDGKKANLRARKYKDAVTAQAKCEEFLGWLGYPAGEHVFRF